MSPALRRRLREAVPTAVLALTVYVPLLFTHPGQVGADTKTYLYLDPSRLLGRATSMWDPNIGMGTVTHQNIGYLWPMGPFYWVTEAIGLPDWVAQRLWLGTILVAAGVGVRFMLKAMGQEGPHVTAATFVYALTPYVLTLGARLSVILLPYAGLPWLIGLAVLALRHQRWREPACFALVIATIGSVNATALLLVVLAPVLWLVHEVFVVREARFGDAVRAGLRISVLTVACSLWWMAGLWAQGGYGIDILRYTETARTVAVASVSLEVLRGLGYWFFYGEDRLGPWIAPSVPFTRRVEVLAGSFVLPGLGLIGAAVTRFRERTYFLFLLLLGLLLAVGGHPWDEGPPAARGIQAFLESDLGLSMRSLPRAAPLVVLALAVFVGSLVASIAAHRPALARPLTAGVMALAVLALPPLWTGDLVDDNLERPEEIPAHWRNAADTLDARDDGTRVLELPGSDFASYRWGNTVDPVLPGLMDRPYVARELIPYGSPPSADLLNAFDRRLQERTFEPTSLAPIARLMGVGDISVRSDLTYERYNTPRPRNLWEQLRHAPGVQVAGEFGPADPNRAPAELPLNDELELTTSPDLPDPPEVGVLAVDDRRPILHTASATNPILVAGSGDGVVDLAAAGLIEGDELLLYSAGLDEAAIADAVDRDATLVLTDSNRRQGRRWGTVGDNLGLTLREDEEPLVDDPTDQALDVFGPDPDPSTQSVAVERGGVWADATSYGNVVSFTPEDRAGNAVDGDTATAWRTGGFADAQGERLHITYREPVTTGAVRLLQNLGGVRNRTITEVELRFDGGDARTYPLDDFSRPEEAVGPDPGQTVTFPERTFRTLDVTITGTDPGDLRSYTGLSSVGFAEVSVTDVDGTTPVADSLIRLPDDLLTAAGAGAGDRPLAIVLTRQRTAPTVAVRSSPEPTIHRLVRLPAARTFALSGEVRLDEAPSDSIIDRVLGLPDAEEGGVTAQSSRRIPGGTANRAMAAIDGDPGTWWSPGFLRQQGDFLRFRTADPVTVDRFDVTLLTDGRHSVPRSLDVTVATGDEEGVTQRVQLGDLTDLAEPNATQTVTVDLPEAVEGDHVIVALPDEDDAVRDVETVDYYSDELVPMPVGVAEIDIDGLEAPATPRRLDDRCRDDLITIDGEPVPVSVTGTTADLLAGEALPFTACDDATVALDEGEHRIDTRADTFPGLDVDRLILRSGTDGAAEVSTEPLVSAATDGPTVEIDASDRTSYDLTVPSADQPFWLVVGQSHNLGWTAEVNGDDLGEPVIVDGYANGWLVPAGTDLSIRVEWTPQRVVRAALWASLGAVLATLVLALRRPRLAVAADDRGPLDARPSMPRSFSWDRVRRYAGPTPGRLATVGVTIGAGLAAWFLIGPIPGVVLAIVARISMRWRTFRPALTVAGPVLFALCVGFLAARQLLRPLPSGFDWPTYFEVVHQPAWTAVALIVLDAVVDRCWLRRWWPTDDSPT